MNVLVQLLGLYHQLGKELPGITLPGPRPAPVRSTTQGPPCPLWLKRDRLRNSLSTDTAGTDIPIQKGNHNVAETELQALLTFCKLWLWNFTPSSLKREMNKHHSNNIIYPIWQTRFFSKNRNTIISIKYVWLRFCTLKSPVFFLWVANLDFHHSS